MAVSPVRRVLKWTLLSIPWILSVALAAGWVLTVWTPDYLEKIVPEMVRRMELPLSEFNVRSAGLFSADIGPVQLGAKGQGVRLNSVTVSYTPTSLRAGRVRSIVVHGLSLDCFYAGERLHLPLLDMILAGKTGEESPDRALPDLPFDTLHIEDSMLYFNGQHGVLAIPFTLTVTPGDPIEFEGTLRVRDQQIRFTALQGPKVDQFRITVDGNKFRLGSLADLMPVPIDGLVNFEIDGEIDMAHPEGRQFSAQIAVSQGDLSWLGLTLAPETSLEANATLSGNDLNLTMAPVQVVEPYPVTLAIPSLHLTPQDLNADLAVTAAGARLPGTLQAQRDGDSWNVDLRLHQPNTLSLDPADRPLRLGGLDLRVSGTAGPDVTAITLKTSTRWARLGQTGLRTGGIALELPLAWPAPKKNRPGRLRATAIRLDERELGSVSARLRQEGMGIALLGELATELLPGLTVPFSGHASMAGRDATLEFGVDRYVLPERFDPGLLVHNLAGILFSGELSFEGGFNVTKLGTESRLGVFMRNGTATFGTSGTVMKGIRLFFESPDLINFHSAPAQLFSFDSLTTGRVTVTDGLATFQVEPRGVVLMERIRFNWAGGRVESRAFRIVPGHEEYDLTLYCSGLKMTEIMHQLGLAKASGDSALDGELPVTWNNGQISFNGGFLHSTPGETGVISVEGLDDLLASIPKGTPEHGQLLLAKHAIKDFEYKWIRLRADTVGRDLLLRLSMDGKPTGILPFVYRKEFGGFIMVEGDVEGSHFQGLRLDVNFNLPLDHILLYKDIIGNIQ